MDDLRPVARDGAASRIAACGNRLLRALDRTDLALIEPWLERVPVSARRVLFEPGEDVELVHFPCAGTVVSLTIALSDGRVAEVAAIGCEGAVGGLISGGHKPAFARALVHIGGAALRLPMARLEAAKAASASLRDLFSRYADVLLAQVMQSVACNALHPVEARACRWLLMLHDRVGKPELPLTQEFLAEVLGVQRTTVTRVLTSLGEAGMIAQRRGRILISDPGALAGGACECYAAVEQHFKRVAPRLHFSDRES